jgi:hypothetical protein
MILTPVDWQIVETVVNPGSYLISKSAKNEKGSVVTDRKVGVSWSCHLRCLSENLIKIRVLK